MNNYLSKETRWVQCSDELLSNVSLLQSEAAAHKCLLCLSTMMLHIVSPSERATTHSEL